MRGTLENSEEKEIPLADELKMIEVYMLLEAMRLGNKFTYEIKVGDGVDINTTHGTTIDITTFCRKQYMAWTRQKRK